MPTLAEQMAASGWKPTAESHDEWGKAAHSGGVPMSSELARIMGLPRRVINLDNVPDLSPLFVHTDYCDGSCGDLCDRNEGRPARLRPIQSAALWDMEQAGGFFGFVGVAHGKELICALAGSVFNSACHVVMGPPSLRDHFDRDWERYSLHFALPPRDTVHFVAYSDLQNGKRIRILDELKPDTIAANECQNLRHKRASRTKRFLVHMKSRPGTRFIGCSGTPTNDSIKDYAHLIEMALGRGTPVPSTRRHYELADWCAAIDVPKGNEEPKAPGALLKLATPAEIEASRAAEESPTELARRVFCRRLVETHGVVATDAPALKCELRIKEIGADEMNTPPSVRNFLKDLSRTWAIPGGAELKSALEVSRIARQASCGLYYRWDWPGGIVDEEWVEAKSAWGKTVRHVLQYYGHKGIDQPLFVANAAMRGELPREHLATWAAWAAVKDRPAPPTVAVWLDDFIVDKAEEWADDVGIGVIWYEHNALGRAIADRLRLPLMEGGCDKQVNAATPKTHPIMVCSIRAHGTGKNLQAWGRAYVTSPPANGTIWEQLLGRHPRGQRRDPVQYDVNVHTWPLRAALNGALADAQYQQTTTRQKQRLLIANWIRSSNNSVDRIGPDVVQDES